MIGRGLTLTCVVPSEGEIDRRYAIAGVTSLHMDGLVLASCFGTLCVEIIILLGYLGNPTPDKGRFVLACTTFVHLSVQWLV